MAKDKISDPLLSNTSEKSAIAKLNKIIIPICYTIAILCYIDRGNLSYAANQFCNAINLTYSGYETGAILFYITYILFGVPSNLILEKVGSPVWLGFLTFFWGISATAMAFVKNEIQYYIVRLLLGLAESGAFPGIFHYIAQMYPENHVTFIYGLIISATLISIPVSAPLAAALLSLDDVLGFEGWQWLFIIEGLIPVFFSIVITFGLPKNIDCLRSLNSEEKAYLKNSNAYEANFESTRERSFWDLMSELVKIKNYWILTVATFLLLISYNTIIYFLTLSISTMLNDTESVIDSETFSSTDLGILPTLITAIPYVFSSIASILVGKYISYVKNSTYYLSFNIFIASCSFGMWTLFQNNLIIVLLCITVAISTAFANTLPVILTIEKSCLNKDLSAIGFATFNGIVMTGGIFGPMAAGYIIDYFGYSVCVLVMSALLLLVSGIFIFVKEN